MANIKRIPPEPARPSVPGGRTRTSRVIDLKIYPAVARRQSVNARLMAGICGHDAAARSPFFAEDATALLRVVQERFDSDQVLLRRQAIVALAEVKTLPAIEQLSAIALSPVQDMSARGFALTAVVRGSPVLGRALAQVVDGDGGFQLDVCAQKAIDTPPGEADARTKAATRAKAGSSGRRKPRVPTRDRT